MFILKPVRDEDAGAESWTGGIKMMTRFTQKALSNLEKNMKMNNAKLLRVMDEATKNHKS